MMLKCSPEAFAKCPTHQYCGNSAVDCDFTEGSDCDKFNQQIASQPVPSCGMCTNATTDPELTPDNDLSYVLALATVKMATGCCSRPETEPPPRYISKSIFLIVEVGTSSVFTGRSTARTVGESS